MPGINFYNASVVSIIMLLTTLCMPACSPVVSDVPDCKSVDVFCIGLVSQLGKMDDQGFNQAVWDAVEQAKKDFGAVGYYIQTTDSRDYDKNISTFAEAGYDVIVTVGSDQKAATQRLAESYPDVKFIGVDQAQDITETVPKNLVGLVFSEDQAGFLAGALAAQMSTSKMIGAVCSTDIVSFVWRYCEGFKAGANYIDPTITVTITYHNDVSSEKAFDDPDWSKTTVDAMVSSGVDVVFGVGGNTGSAAIDAAGLYYTPQIQVGSATPTLSPSGGGLQTRPNKIIYAIGSESDQYFILLDLSKNLARKILLSSVVKMITPAVVDLIKSVKDDKFPGGANINGRIAYTSFHDLEKVVPSEVKLKMLEISKGLMDGSIITNVTEHKP